MMLMAATDQRSADISVDRVTLRYGKGDASVLALSDISLHVAKNEFCVIVGPSGCGKSSLLYLIAGLEDRSGGDIRVGNRTIVEPGPDRGMVFQAYTLFPG
jgi:NitT/TauT family transport system ATP-binding protein